jgi:hypothetical protein
MSERGGKRPGAGRKKNVPDVEDVKIGKGFATRVLSRVAELKLKDPHIGDIKTAEDLALSQLGTGDAEAKSFLRLLLAYQLGKPVQPTITADTREFSTPLARGNSRSYFEEAANAPGSHRTH